MTREGARLRGATRPFCLPLARYRSGRASYSGRAVLPSGACAPGQLIGLISGVMTGVTAGAMGLAGAAGIAGLLRFAAFLFFADFFLAALLAGLRFLAAFFFEAFFFDDFFFVDFFFATRFFDERFFDDFFLAFLVDFFFAAFFFVAMLCSFQC